MAEHCLRNEGTSLLHKSHSLVGRGARSLVRMLRLRIRPSLSGYDVGIDERQVSHWLQDPRHVGRLARPIRPGKEVENGHCLLCVCTPRNEAAAMRHGITVFVPVSPWPTGLCELGSQIQTIDTRRDQLVPIRADDRLIALT